MGGCTKGGARRYTARMSNPARRSFYPVLLLFSLGLGAFGCAGLLDPPPAPVAEDTARGTKTKRADTAAVRVAREEAKRKKAAAARRTPAQLAAMEEDAAKKRVTVIHGGGAFTGVELRCPGFAEKRDLTSGQTAFDDVPEGVNCAISAQGGMPGSTSGIRAGSFVTCVFTGPDFRCR